MNHSTCRRGMRRLLHAWALAAVVLGLHACGGGSDPATTPAIEPAVSEADQMAAGRAELWLTHRASAREVELSFRNPFVEATGLRVDRLVAGTWSPVATLPANTASATTPGSWTDTAPVPGAYRVVALLPGREVPLRTAAGASRVEPRSDLATATLDISSDDGSDPLSSRGYAQVVTHGATPLPIDGYRWTLREDAAGTSAASLDCPNRYCPFDVLALSGGTYRVTTRFDVEVGHTVELSRSVQVDPNHFVLHLHVQRDAATRANVLTHSDAGVVQVRFHLDGQPYATLAQPSGCGSEPCVPGRDASYGIDLPHANIAKGRHTLRVEATDASGRTRVSEQTFEVSDPPVATLQSPLPGQLVNGRLRIQGTARDDRTLPHYTIRLDGTPIASGTGDSFDIDHDISKLAVGEHHLELYTRDDEGRSVTLRRRVVVTAPDAPAFQRVATIPDEHGRAVLVAASGGRVLVRNASFSRNLLFDADAGTPPLLIDALISPTAEVHFANDWLVTVGSLPVSAAPRALAWDAAGRMTDLTALSGVARPSYARVTTAGPWTAWIHGENYTGYVIRRLDTSEQHLVVPPDPIASAGVFWPLLVHDLAGARLFYETRQGHHVYDTRTRVSTPIAIPRDGRPITDGKRLVWRTAGATPGVFAVPLAASAADLAAPTVLSSQVTSTVVAGDGVIAWIERLGDTSTLKVDDGAGTLTLGSGPNGRYGITSVAGGGVLLSESGRHVLWTRSGGARVIHHDSSAPALLSRGWLYLLPSPQYADSGLYRLPF